MIGLAAVFAVSFLVTFVSMPFLIRKLKAAGMTGKDVNKAGKPEVAEMGGLGIVMGFIAALLLAIALNTFLAFKLNLVLVLAAAVTVLIVGLIGIFDDLFGMRQWIKALLPIAAAVPLIAVSAGETTMSLPFIGPVDFGLVYLLVLVPIGVAVASNLTNMLAGFNGLEAGNGAIMFVALAFIALQHGNMDAAVLSLAMLGSLLAFLFSNWHPARVFPGDIGNLMIGAVLASTVIIGNMESVGAILVIPYVIDFFIKFANRFPSSEWWGELRDGKLYPVKERVRGFCQLIMKLANGISEVNLVLVLFLLEAFFGIIVILLYGKVL